MNIRTGRVNQNQVIRNNENAGVPGKNIPGKGGLVTKPGLGVVKGKRVFAEIGNRANALVRSNTTAATKKDEKPAFKKPSRANTFSQKNSVKEKENVTVQEVSMQSVKATEDMSVVEAKPETEEALVEEQMSSDVEPVKDDLEELSNAFSSKLLTVTDIDADDHDNPQLVSEYANEIYRCLKSIEVKYPVNVDYLNGKRITPRMRNILVDWLVQVHYRFGLLQETLYLTLCICDRYLQLEPNTAKDKLQLVGVTSMLIAAKYEEIYPPLVGDLVYITDKAYTKPEIREMERMILCRLDHYISFPLPLHFLRRYSKAGGVDGMQHMLAKYLMELCLPDYSMCHFKSSQIGAASLRLTLMLMGDEPEWTDTLAYYSGYTEAELMPIVYKLAHCIRKSFSSKQQAIPKKYSSTKMMRIGELPDLKGEVVKALAEKAEQSS